MNKHCYYTAFNKLRLTLLRIKEAKCRKYFHLAIWMMLYELVTAVTWHRGIVVSYLFWIVSKKRKGSQLGFEDRNIHGEKNNNLDVVIHCHESAVVTLTRLSQDAVQSLINLQKNCQHLNARWNWFLQQSQSICEMSDAIMSTNHIRC